MLISLAVFGAPQNSQAALSALRFAEAVKRQGHDLYRVFFYHDGVTTGNQLVVAPQDELDVQAAWSSFGKKHNVELIVCIASALRRGLLDSAEADRNEKSNFNLDPAFTISGLGQFIDAGLQSDRLVTFRQ